MGARGAGAQSARSCALVALPCGCSLVAAFTPRPPPPGTINRHIIDMEKWALMDSRDVRYAFKEACRQYALSWRIVFMSKAERAALQRQVDDDLAVREGRTPPSVLETQAREAAAKAAAGAGVDAGAGGSLPPAPPPADDADAPPVVTPEMLREFAAKFGECARRDSSHRRRAARREPRPAPPRAHCRPRPAVPTQARV